MSSPFNVKNYYRFFNSISPNNTISAGVVYNINDPINMTIQETFSSTENWQLFYQSGVYFIRNYQSGADLQLGLTENDLTTPRLLLSSGALGQQWQITARSDNTWRITNGLVSNLSSLGIAPGGATVPAMDTDDTDGHWRIGINQSAGTISNTAMLATVTNVVASPTTSTLSSSSTAISTGASASTITSSPNSSATPAASIGSSSSSPKSSSISGGAIAGIVIGVIALAAIIAGLVFFLLRRRKQKNTKAGVPASELDGTGKPFAYENEKRITPAAPPVEMDAEGQAVRTEIGYK